MSKLEKLFFEFYSSDYTDETIIDLLSLTDEEFEELKEISEKRLDKMFPVCYN